MNALGPRTLYYILEIAFGDLHSSLSHTYHIMNSIPLELFHEIFSRLPTKSIGRFRCVSEETSPLLLPYVKTEKPISRRPHLKSFFFNEKIKLITCFPFKNQP